MQQPHDDGAEHDIAAQLEQKVAADQAEEHVGADAAESGRLAPGRDGIQEKEQAAQQKDAGVDRRADDGSRRHSQIAAAGRQLLIGQSGQRAAGRALEQHGHDRARNADGQECRGVAAGQYHQAEDQAQPRPQPDAADGRADDDGDEHQRDRERPEMHESAHELQQDDQSRQYRAQRQRPGGHAVLVCFHKKILLAVVHFL